MNKLRVVSAVCVATLALAACSPTNLSPKTSAESIINNCGHSVPIGTRPQRIVAIKSSAIEMLLSIGVGDRILATAASDGPVPQIWAAQATRIPVLSRSQPGQEAVLALEPDFIFGGWESTFKDSGLGSRSTLQGMGVSSYVAPSACRSAEYAPGKLAFTDVFDSIDEAGRIFDAEEAAASVIGSQTHKLSSVKPNEDGLTALWWSSGTDLPYVGGNTGAPAMMMESIGLENIAQNLQSPWSSFGWESIIAADPDIIVLVDATWNTAKDKMRYLSENPATSGLSAVVSKSYLVIPFAAGEAGVRNVDATVDLANQLNLLNAK